MKVESEVNVKEVMQDCAVQVKLKGSDVMVWRIAIGFRLIRLAAKIMGVGSCDIEFKRE